MQGAENKVKDFLKSDVVADYSWDVGSLNSFMNRIKLALDNFVLRFDKAGLLAASKPCWIWLGIVVSIDVNLTSHRYEILSFLFPEMSTAVLIVPWVEILHQPADRWLNRNQLVASKVFRVVYITLT